MSSQIVFTNDKHYQDIATAIRNKNGLSTEYKPSQMAEAINALVVGGTVILQDKTVNPSEVQQEVTFDSDQGYMGLDTVTITPILTETKTTTINGDVIPTSGKYLTKVTVNVPQGSTINNQDKSVTPTESQQIITADDGHDYTGLGTVTVGAIPSDYVGSGITRRSSTDLTTSGATVTVPVGYYSEQASKAVATGSAGTPTATKGTVTNHAVSVTPSVTNTTGYITGGTKTGTAVTVSASELVSGKKEITANGDNIDVVNYATVKVAIPGDTPTIDSLTVTPSESEQVFNSSSVDGYKPVTVSAISSTYVGSGINRRDDTDLSASGATVTVPAGYYSTQASKAVSSGSATGPSSLTASSATVTTGTNTITLTKTGVTTTPTVSAGYVSSATSSTATVALTASVTTKGATTYTPGTTDQTISSGTYLTGIQTIAGDSDLVAGNIKNGVTIFGVEGTYSGASINNQAKSFTPDETGAEITPDSGYTGLSKVTVSAISSTYVGSSITRRDDTDLSASGATVTVPAGYYAEQETKSVSSGSTTVSGTISDSSASITTGTNTITLSKSSVSVTPTVSAGYISSGTAGTPTVSLTASVTVDPTPTASGATVTIPAGYYSTQTTKSVSSMTLPGSTSSTSSGTSKATIAPSTSAQYLNIPTGYNGTAQYYTISAMPTMTLPTSASASATSGYTSKATIGRSTSDQYINIPTGYNSAGAYYKISAVANGSATGPSSISQSSATVSTGTNTLTLTKTSVDTTPTVSAGYVSSATASTATVSLTASVTTKAAATINTSTTDQTIASGTYLTGTQTIKAVTVSGLSANTILSGTTVKIGDVNDDDRIASVSGSVTFANYYTGSGAPSSSLGSNGDIYLQL